MAPTPLPTSVAKNLALALVASSNAPLLLLDGNLIVIAASKSFCRAFQIEPGQVAGRSLVGLGDGEWDMPQLAALLRATASGFASKAYKAIPLTVTCQVTTSYNAHTNGSVQQCG